MITLEEVKEISLKVYEEYRNYLDKRIREAAIVGGNYIVIEQEPYCMWLADGYENIKDSRAKEILDELKANGFVVEYSSNPDSRFRYHKLVIRWEV